MSTKNETTKQQAASLTRQIRVEAIKQLLTSMHMSHLAENFSVSGHGAYDDNEIEGLYVALCELKRTLHS